MPLKDREDWHAEVECRSVEVMRPDDVRETSVRVRIARRPSVLKSDRSHANHFQIAKERKRSRLESCLDIVLALVLVHPSVLRNRVHRFRVIVILIRLDCQE